MEKSTMKVKGMTCQHCVKAVKAALENVEHVTNADVDLDSGTAVISYQNEKQFSVWKTAVETAGYQVEE